MECFKEENPISPLRRDGRKLTRCPRLEVNPKNMDAINEACKREKNGDGAVRVKIVVSKEQLKQLMAASNGKMRYNAMLQNSSIEQLLHAIKRKVVAERTGRQVRWRPGLQSIPEETDSSIRGYL
jgi:hypothetical protein